MKRHRFNSIAVAMTYRVVLVACSVLLLLFGGCMGQEQCGAEVKLLLGVPDAQAAATSLQAGPPTNGSVFLYDTGTHDLLAQGAILRVRQGASSDLTVKLRVRDKNFVISTNGDAKRFKCEVDYAGSEPAYSYSAQARFTDPLPTKGEELNRYLNESQRLLLSQGGVVADWKKVKKVAEIRSTAWTIKKQPPFDKLSLELWEWPEGSVLELSARAEPASLRSTYDRLQSLAISKGLTLNSSQQFKTSLVLQKPSR